jgi:hypothetical protein
MLKNILIISTILLLLATMSKITPIDAKSSENISVPAEETNFIAKTSQQKNSPRLNEILTVGTLRQLYEAQKTYRDTVGNGAYGTFDQLYNANLIDIHLVSGRKFGYNFTFQINSNTELIPPTFKFFAVPVNYSKTGKKSFYFDNKCRLRGKDKDGDYANDGDPIIDVCPETNYLPQTYEVQVISAMRDLANAQFKFQSSNSNGNFGTFQELLEAGLIDEDLADGSYYYNYFTLATQTATSETEATFKFWSKPGVYEESGFRSFYIDESGTLYGADHQGGPADENDPPIRR